MEQNKRIPIRRFKGFTDDWKERELEELGVFGKNYSYSRAQEGPGDYYHIHYGDIHTKFNGIIEKNTLIPSIKVQGDYDLLKNGDIVIADASEDYKDLGKTVVLEETDNRKIIAGLHTFKFTPNKYLHSTFYLYYSQSDLFKKFAARTGTGISVFGISRENISKMTFKLPTYPEQQKIGSFFKQVDEAITLQQRKLKKTRSIKSAYLAEMFPAEGERVPKRRFAGFTSKWEERKLGEFVSIKSGWSPSNFKKEDEQNSSLFIKVDDLNYTSREQNRSQMKVQDNPQFTKVKKGSTIFPKRGAAIMTNKVRILDSSVYMDTNMMALEPESIDEGFLYSFIEKTGLYKIADTSTIPQINNKHIEPYVICIPERGEQTKIGNFFKQIDKIITLHQRKLDKLKKLKQAYLHEMFV